VSKIVLQAAPTAAPCENVPVAVMGHVSINFVVKTAYCSAPILITVPPKARPPASKCERPEGGMIPLGPPRFLSQDDPAADGSGLPVIRSGRMLRRGAR